MAKMFTRRCSMADEEGVRHLPLATPVRDVPALLAPASGVEEPSSEPYSSPLARWEAPCGVEDDAEEEEFDHAGELAELLAIGTRSGWIVKPGELAIGKQIGLGCVGAVFKGTHIPSGRIVAVKAIRPDLTERTRKRNRTLQDMVSEIDQLSTVGQHPSIVGFVGARIDESNSAFPDPIMILEYMDGGCLQDVLEAKSKNGSPWRPPKATSYSWCAQLCAALSFLHDRETPLVHRDVKAANLFCSAELTTLKLGDFGLCRPVRTLQGGNDTRVMTGMTGTLTHMAPEVFTAAPSYSEKADVFSAAVCMMHLISGEHAYEVEAVRYGWRPSVLARRVAMNGYRASLETKIKHDAMRDLITRMWAQEPAERPSSHECVVELEALLSAVKAGSRKPTAVLNRTKSLLSLAAVVKREPSVSPSSPVLEHSCEGLPASPSSKDDTPKSKGRHSALERMPSLSPPAMPTFSPPSALRRMTSISLLASALGGEVEQVAVSAYAGSSKNLKDLKQPQGEAPRKLSESFKSFKRSSSAFLFRRASIE